MQDTIAEMVPKTHICTKSKRWWTKELTQLRRSANKLGRQASKLSDCPYHKVYAKHADAAKLYHNTLETKAMTLERLVRKGGGTRHMDSTQIHLSTGNGWR